jgi:geranylgeranyl diphosphate synthase, type II
LKEQFTKYQNKFESELKAFLDKETAARPGIAPGSMYSLFDPVKYIMANGGKRIRPLLLMLSCEAFGGNADEAVDAAIAIEILHNFTLVHDDIMDNAPTRRGKVTIHKKWDVNTAILVGDELIGLSYRSLLRTKTERISEVVKTFTDGVIEVCEGQALDKEFEIKQDVSINDYYLMIRKKTAELLKTAATMGAIIGKADENSISALREYAENIGLAFQIHDDLLDVIANETKFGKKIGGDILEKKKTFLYLKALEVLSETDRKTLISQFNNDAGSSEKIKSVVKLYADNCVLESAKKEIKKFTEKADNAIAKMNLKGAGESLAGFSSMLLNRNY